MMDPDKVKVPDPDSSRFAQLAAEKQQELQQLQALHAQSLGVRLREKDLELAEQQEKFHTLKEDFKYNLKLLAERDQELERLEITQDQLRGRLTGRDAEVSELKIEIDRLQTKRAQDERSLEDLQRHYQQRLREKQAEVEAYKTTKDAELEKEREEVEAVRTDLRRRIREVEEELDLQRRELTAGFDDASRRREQEYRSKIEELSSTLLAHEMKVKLLTREVDVVRGAGHQASADLKQTDSKMGELRKQLQHTQWELTDLRGIKDAQIAELEGKLSQAETVVQRTKEEYTRKHQEAERWAREREAAMGALREAQAEAERRLQGEVRRLEGELENREVETRRMDWEHQDAIKDKEILVDKLQQELAEVKGQSDSHLGRVSKEMVSKDLVIESLRDKETKLRQELESRRMDIERYQKELVAAGEKEQGLEQSRAQLELDWQRRYEEAERNQYSKSEALIASLTSSRDQAVALNKELEREMDQMENLNRVLARDRDQAVATLRKHSLHIDRDLIPNKDDGSDDLASRRVEELQAQNASLIAVIRDMKREMEEMTGMAAHRKTGDIMTSMADHSKTRHRAKEGKGSSRDDQSNNRGSKPFTGEYVKSLEKECRELKSEKRGLEERLTTLAQSIYQEGGTGQAIRVDLSENDTIKSHIQSLNDTIGALRADKVTTSAELRRLQTHLAHMQAEHSQKHTQPREHEVEADQLRYELTSQARRHGVEMASLAQRIAQLELQLAQAQREADEYYKGSLQTNMEATALGQQVSELTLDLAGRGQTGGHGIQNALVSQLQREVRNLRAQLARAMPHPRAPHPGKAQSSDTSDLEVKLKTAARYISRLAKERQQLIEMGNRLRAEIALYRPAAERPRVKEQGEVGVTAGRLANQVAAKLENLEKLQYALTKQELQFARQRVDQTEGETEVVQVQLSSPSSDSPNEDPSPRDIGVPERGVARIHPPRQEPDQPQLLAMSQSSDGNTPSSDSSSANQRRTPLMMSSLGEESMQDVWRLLDDGASPVFFRSPSPMHKPVKSPILEEPHPTIPSSHHTQAHPTPGLQVAGQGTHMQARGSRPRDRPQLSSMAAGRVQHKVQPPKRKIRNYAVRDDEGIS